MMKGIRVFSIAVAALMVMVVFGTAVMASAPAAMAAQTVVDPAPEEFGPEMRAKTFGSFLEAQTEAKAMSGLSSAAAAEAYVVGNKSYYVFPNLYSGGWSVSVFTLKAVGDHCEIWVQDNRNYTYGTERNDRVGITDGQIASMLEEFETNIYPIESDYFGVPPPRNGSESIVQDVFGYGNITTSEDGRVMIMILNIRDDSYYDPTYPYYVAGFFSPTSDLLYDRNIIHIDCWDWVNRTGPASARPYLYEGTFAHEYQHLLHDGLDAAEDSFINEGCSDYAEMLCGYGVPWGHIDSYLFTPSNSLTVWGDQGDINILADYGAAALFMIYLSDHFGGGSFVSTLAANPETGIAGVNAALAESGYSAWNFEKVFKYWKLANLIHSNYPGAGWYNYKSLDLSESPVQIDYGSSLSYYPGDGIVSRSNYFGSIWTENDDDTGVSTLNAYGIDYIKVYGNSISSLRAKLTFDGPSFVEDSRWGIYADENVPGLAEGNFYWSGSADLIDYALRGEIDLTDMTEATLAFNTYWDIEDFWDFGFVQVSTDGGLTWTSVANDNTTVDYDPSAHPDIIANLPGLTGYDYGRISYDLSEYAGQSVLVQFRYMTDWGTYYDGWFINNITLNDVLIDNAYNVTTFAPVYPEVDYRVTLYAPMSYYRGMILPTRIVDMSLRSLTDMGSVGLSTYAKYQYFYIIVSPTNGPVDYEFGITTPLTLRR